MVKFSETERKQRMNTSNLMEQIVSKDNLNQAYLQVVRNKGAEGVDGMKYTELKEYLVENGEIIKEQLRTRKYKPQPVRRVEIPKPDGGIRNLGVPTVMDCALIKEWQYLKDTFGYTRLKKIGDFWYAK